LNFRFESNSTGGITSTIKVKVKVKVKVKIKIKIEIKIKINRFRAPSGPRVTFSYVGRPALRPTGRLRRSASLLLGSCLPKRK
jgi:hypothetical protein